jgi:hypothetical protein
VAASVGIVYEALRLECFIAGNDVVGDCRRGAVTEYCSTVSFGGASCYYETVYARIVVSTYGSVFSASVDYGFIFEDVPIPGLRIETAI